MFTKSARFFLDEIKNVRIIRIYEKLKGTMWIVKEQSARKNHQNIIKGVPELWTNKTRESHFTRRLIFSPFSSVARKKRMRLCTFPAFRRLGLTRWYTLKRPNSKSGLPKTGVGVSILERYIKPKRFEISRTAFLVLQFYEFCIIAFWAGRQCISIVIKGNYLITFCTFVISSTRFLTSWVCHFYHLLSFDYYDKTDLILYYHLQWQLTRIDIYAWCQADRIFRIW